MTTAELARTALELIDRDHFEALMLNEDMDVYIKLIASRPMGDPDRARAERWMISHDLFGVYG